MRVSLRRTLVEKEEVAGRTKEGSSVVNGKGVKVEELCRLGIFVEV